MREGPLTIYHPNQNILFLIKNAPNKKNITHNGMEAYG